MFRLGWIGLGLALGLACVPVAVPVKEGQLLWRGQTLHYSYQPASPQIGDQVRLTVKPLAGQSLPATWPLSWGTDLGRIGADRSFRVLVRHPGPWQPKGLAEPLWVVADTGKQPWIELSEAQLFQPSPWGWGQTGLVAGGSLALVVGLVWLARRRRRSPGVWSQRRDRLQGWQTEPSPDWRAVYRELGQLDRDWRSWSSPPPALTWPLAGFDERRGEALFSRRWSDEAAARGDLAAGLAVAQALAEVGRV